MITFGRWMLIARVAVAVGCACLLAAVVAARAEAASPGTQPLMGWTSWDFLREDPTEATVEAEAQAMVTSGLKSVGYEYVNVDDFWYACPGPQGPTVDRYGRWVADPAKFPSQGSVNGIQATANYVHSLGLKFGIYITPGISKQAVAQNTRIAGTHDTAREIATGKRELNYNCGGMVGIDYAKPGAQAFIDSWADELAKWGVDDVKLDGVGASDIPDVVAWSRALRQTGRPIRLELSNNLNIADARTWAQYASSWRTGPDIDCYCSPSSYPLTDWLNVLERFDAVAAWAPYGHAGVANDYDAIEVGNGDEDGLTPAERQTQLSLWALAAAPLVLGTDLTHLDPYDRSLLLNRAVISVDQDGVDAHRLLRLSSKQVFAKRERSGDVAVGLFNTGMSPAVLTTTTSALGLAHRREYAVDNLWTGQVADTGGRIDAEVPPGGVALFRVARAPRAAAAPLQTIGTSGPTVVPGPGDVTERVTFTNDGVRAAHGIQLSLAAPAGWTITPRSRTSFASVAPGAAVSARFQVAIPQAAQPFSAATLSASASGSAAPTAATAITVTGAAVRSPFATYSSAHDPRPHFSQVGSQFGIEGAGAGLFTDNDDYTAIYEKGVVTASSAVTVELTDEPDQSGYAKAGIIVRNRIPAAGTKPEGVILSDSPGTGIQLEYDRDAGVHIDAATPHRGRIPVGVPVYLRLVRNGATYSGFYSTDGATWLPVGSATLPGQAPVQDGGMFVTSSQAGMPGVATFSGFSVS